MENFNDSSNHNINAASSHEVFRSRYQSNINSARAAIDLMVSAYGLKEDLSDASVEQLKIMFREIPAYFNRHSLTFGYEKVGEGWQVYLEGQDGANIYITLGCALSFEGAFKEAISNFLKMVN